MKPLFVNIKLACLIGILSSNVNAQTNLFTFQSSEKQTSLLELYTSEGCSSCPPAEAWLSRLKTSPGLWRDFVPVAFHVDYWDYLGWRDPWGSKQFSNRQKLYADHWRNESVYTPGLVLNGIELRDWSPAQTIPDASATKAGVLTITSSDTNRWQVSFTPSKPGSGDYEIHTALLESGVSSKVKSGENRGRNLLHDFAVLRLVNTTLVGRGNEFGGEFVLTTRQESSTGNLAIAGWITQGGRLEPVQATGGWLNSPFKK